MADYTQEQEMEIEALEAILMDDFKEIHAGESGFGTSNRCFQIKISPQDDETDFDSTTTLVQLALVFSHTEKYPDEPPLLNLKSLRGIPIEDLRILKEKLQQEASENLGMAMIYTLVTSTKEWLSERFQDSSMENAEAEEATKDEIIVPHGEPVTLDTFLAWREKFEAELALERAKLMPESALTAPKEKKLTGRQWFETGRASAVFMLSMISPSTLKVHLQSPKDPMKKMRKTLTLMMRILKMMKICLSTTWPRKLTYPHILQRELTKK